MHGIAVLRPSLLVALLVLLVALGLAWLAGGARVGVRSADPSRASEDARRAPEGLAQPRRAEPDGGLPLREPAPGGGAMREAAPEPVRVAAPPAAVDPPPGAVRLTGVLRFADDGAPVPRARLSFSAGGSRGMTVTDEAGRFEAELAAAGGFVRIALPSQERYPPPCAVEPSSILLPDGDGPHALELRLIEPNAHLRVLVRAAGEPVQARVVGRWPRGSASASSDAEGRAELAFVSMQVGDRVSVTAEAGRLHSQEEVVVYPWTDEQVVLDLRPTGSIRARVVDAGGRPAPGLWVAIERRGLSISRRTDEAGVALLAPVPAGTVEVEIRGREQSTLVGVNPGECAEVEFELPPSEIVVAGRVVDERGDGLADVDVHAQAAGWFGRDETLAGGRFEIHGEPGRARGSVHVAIGGGADDEIFTPEELEVQPGTLDVLFQRRPPIDSVDLSIAILDARTHEPIRPALVVMYRTPRPQRWDSYFAPEGLITCPLKPRDDVRILARAIGYRGVELGWSDVGAEARAGKPLRIELAEGYDQDLQVLSWTTHAPLAGAALFDGEERVATTDSRGRARVTLASWPDALRAELEGFHDESMECDELVHEPVGTFWLEPLD